MIVQFLDDLQGVFVFGCGVAVLCAFIALMVADYQFSVCKTDVEEQFRSRPDAPFVEYERAKALCAE